MPDQPEVTCCDRCNARRTSVVGVRDEVWCDECTQAFAFHCPHCDEYHPRSYRKAVGNEWWCEECADDDSFVCHHCNCRWSVDEENTVNGASWCQACCEQHAFTCDRCEESFHRDDSCSVNGEIWCEECADSSASTCQSCQDLMPADDDGSAAVGGEWWCGNCVENHSFWCEFCDEQRPLSEERRHSSDVGICQSCIDRGEFLVCQACEAYFHEDDEGRPQLRDGTETRGSLWMCDQCYDTERSGSERPSIRRQRIHSSFDTSNGYPSGSSTSNMDWVDMARPRTPPPVDARDEMRNVPIQNYSWKPTNFTFYLLPADMKRNPRPNDKPIGMRDIFTFGVEVEMESTKYIPNDVAHMMHEQDKWGLLYSKDDGSIGNQGPYGGFEAVSFPASWGWAMENQDAFDPIFDMRHKGCRSYNTISCGMHIHIGKRGFVGMSGVPIHMFKFARFVFSNYEFIHRMSRRKESYLKKWAAVSEVSNGDLKRWIEDPANYQPDRKLALNFRCPDTVECRIFRGTLNKSGFWANVEFLKALFDYTQTCSMKALTPDAFSAWAWQRSHDYPNFLGVLGARLPVASV